MITIQYWKSAAPTSQRLVAGPNKLIQNDNEHVYRILGWKKLTAITASIPVDSVKLFI